MTKLLVPPDGHAQHLLPGTVVPEGRQVQEFPAVAGVMREMPIRPAQKVKAFQCGSGETLSMGITDG